MRKYLLFCLAFCVLGCSAQDLIVRLNDPIICKREGDAFLWLRDTAWELLRVLDREEIIHYLDSRQEKGFTVIQAVILSELDGLDKSNAYGYLPLVDKDPTQITEGYFELVDFVIREAGKRGMYIGLLPTWANSVVEKDGNPALFNPDNAYTYGKILGTRHKNEAVIWILGGDRNVVTNKEFDIWQSMAKGIQERNGGTQPMFYHPTGEISSHYWFRNESWLSFNILQSGHYRRMDPVYRFSGMYAQLNSIKSFVNAEPSYEDIPALFWEYFDYAKLGKKKEDTIGDNGLTKDTTYLTDGIYDDYDIRVQAYWTYFSGATGYTYENNAIWQMYKSGGKCHVPCLTFWDGALDRPRAGCMRYVKSLFTMYSLDRFRPDLSVLFGINYNDVSYIIPVLAEDRTFILVYLSQGQDVRIQMSKLRSLGKAHWPNPRDEARTLIGPVGNKGIRTFSAPGEAGERGSDWTLILEADGR